ncbi:hypothetical protein GALL_550440 [mine drainage metagenome]|uniref:Uncharacterized protein n=1 Tax=mine drainage metagenome TaxID=410659 RepID=A0A1J5P6J6_9ZZZZ
MPRIINAKENVKIIMATIREITRGSRPLILRDSSSRMAATVLISGTGATIRRLAGAHLGAAIREAAIALISGTGMHLKITGQKKNLQKKIYKTR